MEPRARLQSLVESLDAAQALLQARASSYPVLLGPSRALQRIAHIVKRPLRLAILGESNSGKSTLANLIAGEMALPALPVANTRLPTLLHFAPAPRVDALHESGERFSLGQGRSFTARNIVRLEVGLPSERLRRVEILDFPGSANPLFRTDLVAVLRHRIDAAFWATVATQAWRETERLAWMGLPERIRRRGLLVVTHCDLIGSEEDFRKLKGRLEEVEKAFFSAMSFADSTPHTTAALLRDVDHLVAQFEVERLEKAIAVTQQLAQNTHTRLETGPL